MNTLFLTVLVLIVVPVVSIFVWRSLQFLDQINKVDWGRPGLNYVAGLNQLLCYRYHRLTGDTVALPAGGCIVVSNHVSGLDALLLIAAANRPLRFLIAKEQYQRFGVHWLLKSAGCIPVEREKRPERAFREALRTLDRGEALALFPHGKLHLDSDPPRRLKGGVVKLAQLSGCPIYPVRLDGIKGQGHTILSIPIRSKARLKIGEPIFAKEMDENACLDKIAQHIEKPIDE